MPNEVNIYTPRYLAEVVRQAPPLHTFFRDTFFTNVKTFVTERVDIDIVKGNRRMAAFVHPKAGGQILESEGYATESYAAPLINPYDVTTADRFMTRLAGEDLYSSMTPAQRAARQLMDDYMRLNDAATRREEWMAAQVILTGQIPVKGKGVDEVISFGFTNKKTLTGTAQWGKSAAKIRNNLSDWVTEVSVNGFSNIDMAILGKNALRALLADEDIYKALDNRRMILGEIAPHNLPNGVRYIGWLADPGIDLYTYNEVYLDDWTDPNNPVTKPLMPDNKVVLAPRNPGFMRAYAACTYIEESSGEWVTSQTARLLRCYTRHGPDRRILELQTRPLMIPDRVDSWLVAEVC